MSITGSGPFAPFARRKPPHRIIISRGEHVRTFTIRPWMAGTIAAFGALFTFLYLAATGYLVFRDDLLAASITRQGRMQQAYEDRIASLRADIDRLTSRQLINQQAFDAKMDRLLGRQADLDARQDIIAGLSQAVRRAGLTTSAPESAAPADAGAAPADASSSPADAAPAAPTDGINDKDLPITTGSIAPAAGVSASAAVALLRSSASEDPLPASGEVARLGAIETSLDALAQSQVAYVESVASTVAGRTDKIAGILKKLGRSVPAAPEDEDGVGGPFIPLDESADPQTFRTGVGLVTDEVERLTAVRRIAAELPLARPLPNAAVTSRFGARIDPFLGRPAMHPGIDFMAPTGYPVRTTAGGTVITADNAGGYGNMVEIDHGNGVTTRYGHLSQILVKAGQIVPKDAIIGRIGSTGRSTGPHLHYEVRLDGQAIDPMRYIRAGTELGPLL